MECDRRGRRKRNLTLVPFPRASKRFPKDGCQFCQLRGCFPQFLCRIWAKQVGIFSFYFEFFESTIFQKPLKRFPLIICLDLGKHPRVSQISFARQGESLEKSLKGCCIASTLDYTELCW